MLASRLYAAVLLLAIAGLVAGELLPRDEAARRLRISQLGARLERMEATKASIEARAAREAIEPGDEDRFAAVTAEIEVLRREWRFRAARVGVVFGAVAASLVFAAVSLPGVMRRRFGRARRSGEVEIEPEERIHVDPIDAPGLAAKLFTSRREAVDSLLAHPPLRCDYCGTPWRPKVLGRIGKRVLIRRPPPGAVDLEQVVGEGWWARPAEPPPCAKCGAKTLVPETE